MANTDDLVREYSAARRAEATYRAYASDWRGWIAWLAHLERPWQVATDEDLARYLATRARGGTRSTTLERIASGINQGYLERGLAPVRGEITSAALSGIRRRHGWGPKRALPLTVPLIRRLIDAIPRRHQRGRDRRDRALLLVMWQGALRRGEAVSLEWPDVRPVGSRGVMLLLRETKGERTGASVEVPLVEARDGRYCPIRALRAWQAVRQVDEGPVFVASAGSAGWLVERLSPPAVNKILLARMDSAGLETAGFSTHSLRAGFLTSAALAGTSAWRLREHSRHKRSETLDLYVRDARLLETHPAAGLL